MPGRPDQKKGTVTEPSLASHSSGQHRGPRHPLQAQFFVSPEEQGEPEGEGQEPRRETNYRDAIAPRHPPEDREARAKRADDESDDSGDAGLPNADAQEKSVERQAEGNREAHVPPGEGP